MFQDPAMNNEHQPLHYGHHAPTGPGSPVDFMRQNDPGNVARAQNPYPGGGGMMPSGMSPNRGRQTVNIPGGQMPAGMPGGGMYSNGPPPPSPGMPRAHGSEGGPPIPGMIGGPPLEITATTTPNGDGLPPPPGDPGGPPAAIGGGGGDTGSADPSGAAQDFLSAPYQSMLNRQGQEDPTVARARSIMESHKEHNKKQTNPLPLPRASMPSKPKALAVEPALPSARLGRRCILAQKNQRVPDLTIGTHFTSPAQLQELQQQMQQGIVTVMCIVECAACGNTLQTKKAAVLTQCPVCHKVFQTASCLQHGN